MARIGPRMPAIFIGGPLDRREDIFPYQSYKGQVYYAFEFPNIKCPAPFYADGDGLPPRDLDRRLLPHVREYKCEFITAAGNAVYTFVKPDDVPDTRRFTIEVECIGGEQNELVRGIVRDTIVAIERHPSAFTGGVGPARIVED